MLLEQVVCLIVLIALLGICCKNSLTTRDLIFVAGIATIAVCLYPRIKTIEALEDDQDKATEIARINTHNIAVLDAEIQPLIDLKNDIDKIKSNADVNRKAIKEIGDRAKADSSQLVGKPSAAEEAELDPR